MAQMSSDIPDDVLNSNGAPCMSEVMRYFDHVPFGLETLSAADLDVLLEKTATLFVLLTDHLQTKSAQFLPELWRWVQHVDPIRDDDIQDPDVLLRQQKVSKVTTLYTLVGTAGRIFGNKVSDAQYVTSLTQQYNGMVDATTDSPWAMPPMFNPPSAETYPNEVMLYVEILQYLRYIGHLQRGAPAIILRSDVKLAMGYVRMLPDNPHGNCAEYAVRAHAAHVVGLESILSTPLPGPSDTTDPVAPIGNTEALPSSTTPSHVPIARPTLTTTPPNPEQPGAANPHPAPDHENEPAVVTLPTVRPSTTIRAAKILYVGETTVQPSVLPFALRPQWSDKEEIFLQTEKYYRDLSQQMIKKTYPFVLDDKGHLVDGCGKAIDILRRMEFCSVVDQTVIKKGFKVQPKLNRSADLFMEDSKLNVEKGKRLSMSRRDWAYSANPKTRGAMFVYTMLHMRSIVKYRCKQKPCGKYDRMQCNNEHCKWLGPCLLSGCTVDSHNVSKWEMLAKICYAFRIIFQSSEVLSYDNLPKQVYAELQAHGFDMREGRYLQYQTDPDSEHHGYSPCTHSLQSAYGNLPGVYLNIESGWADDERQSEVPGHPVTKYLSLDALDRCGVDYFISTSDGGIRVDCSKLTADQVRAMEKFCHAYMAYNRLQEDAGYSATDFNLRYPEGWSEDDAFWPYLQSDSDLRMKRGTFSHDNACTLYHQVQASYNVSLARNQDDPTFGYMNQSIRYREVKKSLHPMEKAFGALQTFAAVHRIAPELCSLGRPTATALIDNIVCSNNRCNSASCLNTASRVGALTILLTEFKKSAICKAQNDAIFYGYSDLKPASPKNRSHFTRFLAANGVSGQTVRRILKIYGTPVTRYYLQVANDGEEEGQLENDCYYLDRFQIYVSYSSNLPQLQRYGTYN